MYLIIFSSQERQRVTRIICTWDVGLLTTLVEGKQRNFVSEELERSNSEIICYLLGDVSVVRNVQGRNSRDATFRITISWAICAELTLCTKQLSAQVLCEWQLLKSWLLDILETSWYCHLIFSISAVAQLNKGSTWPMDTFVIYTLLPAKPTYLFSVVPRSEPGVSRYAR